MAKYTVNCKFESSKEWSNSLQESRNPWSTSSTYIDVGSLQRAMVLAERSGVLSKKQEDGNQDEVKQRARRKSPSIKLIEHLEILDSLRGSLHKVNYMIHKYHMEQETKDLTNPSILNEKTKRMEELSLHFSEIVDKKDELINRLQQPFVGDYIIIDAEYHRYMADTIPCLASVISNLNIYLETITLTTQFTWEDDKMEKILTSVSSVLAQMQSFYQSLCLSRNLVSKLLRDTKSAEK